MLQALIHKTYNRTTAPRYGKLLIWAVSAWLVAFGLSYVFKFAYTPIANLLLGTVAMVLNSAGVANSLYKHMLTTAYNTLYLEWFHTPLAVWLAAVLMAVWLQAPLWQKLVCALCAIAIAFIMQVAWLLLCVVYAPAINMLWVVIALHVLVLATLYKVCVLRLSN